MTVNDRETFKMTYSAETQDEVGRIRQKYLPQEPDKMEQLRALDAGVEHRATMVSVTVGVVGTLLLGLGMSLLMSDFGKLLGTLAMPIGIVGGMLGIAVLACAYPLYQRTLRREREKVAPKILRLTEELMK